MGVVALAATPFFLQLLMPRTQKPMQPARFVAANPPAAGRIDWLWYAAFLLLVFLLGCFDLTNGDIWWHLRTGQLIWQHGQVPRTDWYTYSNPESPWIDLHWGFQLAAAALWALGGSAALILAKSALGTATFGLCLTLGSRRWAPWQTVAVWLGPLLIFAGRYFVRPEICTMLLLAATLVILDRAPERRRLLWLLPVIQLVWVNVQGLFVLQFAVLGCALIGRLVRQLLAWGRQIERPLLPLGHLAGAAAACVLASLINPYGIRGTLFPLLLFQRVRGPQREFFHQFSGELRGFDTFLATHGISGVMTTLTPCLLVLLFLGGLCSFAALLALRRLSVYRLLLFAGFSYLAWKMTRNSVPFAIVGGAVLRLNLDELVQLVSRRSSRTGQAPAGRRPVAAVLVAVLLGALIVAVPSDVYFQLQPTSMGKHFGLGQADWYCHAAAQFLRQGQTPKYVYAWHGGVAAVCIYHLGPETKVFADARLEVNTPQTLERYAEILRRLTAGDAEAEELLRVGIPPGPDGQVPLPALVLDHSTLIAYSTSRPGLIDHLLDDGRWRCVFTEPSPRDLKNDPARLTRGASVFIDETTAQRAGFEQADISFLRQLIDWRRGSLAPRPAKPDH